MTLCRVFFTLKNMCFIVAIISIDYENYAAMAKVEISHPNSLTLYIDYFILLKTDGKWTVVHKVYTKQSWGSK